MAPRVLFGVSDDALRRAQERDAPHSQGGLAFEPGFLLLSSKNISLGISNA